jgi:hypothetical protein
MVRKNLIVALSTLIIASPLAAASFNLPPGTPAPPGGPETLYCLRVGPITGNLAETIECWTRAEWADQGVNVDREWAKNGVRALG